MKLYKDDVLEAVEHKINKHDGYHVREFVKGGGNCEFDGYMTALVDYAALIRTNLGESLDYENEQRYLDFIRRRVVSTGATLRYTRGYKAGCLAIKSILHRLKMEGRGKA